MSNVEEMTPRERQTALKQKNIALDKKNKRGVFMKEPIHTYKSALLIIDMINNFVLSGASLRDPERIYPE